MSLFFGSLSSPMFWIEITFHLSFVLSSFPARCKKCTAPKPFAFCNCAVYIYNWAETILLILDGTSEIGAQCVDQSLLFDLLKAFDKIEKSQKYFFFSEEPYFPSYVHNMFWVTIQYNYYCREFTKGIARIPCITRQSNRILVLSQSEVWHIFIYIKENARTSEGLSTSSNKF